MEKSNPPPLKITEQAEALEKIAKCAAIARRAAPRLTISGLEALIYIAIKTLDKSEFDLPTVNGLFEKVGGSRSGASRVITSLTSSGRKKDDQNEGNGGYDLITTIDDRVGLKEYSYVLTPKGISCVIEMMSAISGRDASSFSPHGVDTLFRKLFISG